jgi:hypothetical protein
MSSFEFFMTFYGLLLGLAVAEVLLGFANLLRHRARPRLGLLTPLLGLLVFLQLMAIFIDAWSRLQSVAITMEGLALPTAIGVMMFFVSVILVPRDPAEWSDLDDYFRLNRRWTIGLLIGVNILVLGYEAPFVQALLKGGQWFNFGYWVAINVLYFATIAGALLLHARRAIVACLALQILLYVYVFSGFSLVIFNVAPGSWPPDLAEGGDSRRHGITEQRPRAIPPDAVARSSSTGP